MELLFIGLVELLLPLLTAAVTLMVNALVLLADLSLLLCSLLSGRWASSKREGPAVSQAEATEKKAKKRKPGSPWPKRILGAALALLLLLVSGAVIVNAFYFEPAIKWMAGQAQKRSGIQITFDAVEGSFFSGRFDFQGLKLSKPSSGKTAFDFSIGSAKVDVSMTDMALRRIVFDSADIRDITGDFARQHKGMPKSGPSGTKKNKSGRQFQVNNLAIDNLKINYQDLAVPGGININMEINELAAKRLSSRWFIQDILFAEKINGSINGAKFNIATAQEDAVARRSLWSCRDMSVEALGAILGGPFKWFGQGSVDIQVGVENEKIQNGVTTFKWAFIFSDFTASAPEGLSAPTKALAAPVISYLNSKSDRLELGLEIKLSSDDLEYATSEDLADMFQESLGKTITDSLKQSALTARDKWKLRKKPGSEE